MSTQTKTILKSYFETGDKPTQSQFADLIDSMALVTDLPNGIPVNEPIPVDASITVSDIGKLAMLDYDGNIKLYEETQGLEGIKGKWKIKFNTVSSNNVQFNYEERNGQYISVNSNSWVGVATTPEEEAASFLSYIHNSYSYTLTATAGNNTDEVILEQTTAKEMYQMPQLNQSDAQVDAIQSPQVAIPTTPKRVCIGIIKNVDEQNHTALFEDIIVLQKTTAPSVAAILVAAQSKNGAEHAMELAKLIAVPTNGGLVRAITTSEMQDQNFIFNAAQNALYFFIKPHAESDKYYFLKRGLG